MNTLKVGDKIPAFECLDDKENLIKSENLKGNKLVVFFYPRANTPGCTAQACNISENYEALTSAGYKIIGISGDKVKTQNNFSSKYGFQYPLLADENKNIIKLFGVWGPKKFRGKEYDGTYRKTFVFDENLIVTHVFDKVDTKNHSNQILSL